MYAADAEFAGPHRRAPPSPPSPRTVVRWEELISLMSGRGGPFGDPRMFKAMFWGPGPGGHGPHHRGGGPRARTRGDVRAAMLLLPRDGEPRTATSSSRRSSVAPTGSGSPAPAASTRRSSSSRTRASSTPSSSRASAPTSSPKTAERYVDEQPRRARRPVRRGHRQRRRGRDGPARPDVPGRRRGHAGRRRRPHRRGQAPSCPRPGGRSTRSSPRTSRPSTCNGAPPGRPALERAGRRRLTAVP